MLSVLGRSIRLTFVNVDPNNHAREFKFVVHQNDSSFSGTKYVLLSNYFVVDACHPPVDASFATEKLNKTRDVIKFILDMRNLFKQSL